MTNNPNLFHVTTEWKAKNILKHGMMTSMPTSEEQGNLRAWMDREEYNEITPEILDEYYEDVSEYGRQESAEELARDKMNELMPEHSHSLFFWATESEAEYVKSKMENRGYTSTNYVILGIDSNQLEETPYIADFELSDEIFSELTDYYNSSYDESKMEEIYEMGEEYEESKEPYNEHEDDNIEVIYPHSVPRKAIVTYNGENVSVTENQKRLDTYGRGRGRGWWNHPQKHALASKGIKMRWKYD